MASTANCLLVLMASAMFVIEALRNATPDQDALRHCT